MIASSRKLILFKVRARELAAKAQRAGLLVQQPCERCGEPDSQKHHDDYEKPLEVRWLCLKCHHAVHVELRAARGITKRRKSSLVRVTITISREIYNLGIARAEAELRSFSNYCSVLLERDLENRP